MASTVTVVIPCFNFAEYLGEAIRSAQAQTRPPVEIIVVDDCSTDGSIEVARAHGAVVLTTPANAGVGGARNLGIAAARGDLIAFLDADDIWESDHLAVMVPLLEAHPDVVLGFCAIRRFGTREGIWQAEAPVGQPFDALWPVLTKVAHPPPCTTIVPREALRTANGFDPERGIAEDYDLWMRLALQGPFIYSDHVGARYRCHPEQMTVRRTQAVRAAYRAREKLLTYGPERRPDLAEQIHDQVRSIWRSDMLGAWAGGNQEAGTQLLQLGRELGLVRGTSGAAWRLLWRVFPLVATIKRLIPPSARRQIGRWVFGIRHRRKGVPAGQTPADPARETIASP